MYVDNQSTITYGQRWGFKIQVRCEQNDYVSSGMYISFEVEKNVQLCLPYFT